MGCSLAMSRLTTSKGIFQKFPFSFYMQRSEQEEKTLQRSRACDEFENLNSTLLLVPVPAVLLSQGRRARDASPAFFMHFSFTGYRLFFQLWRMSSSCCPSILFSCPEELLSTRLSHSPAAECAHGPPAARPASA